MKMYELAANFRQVRELLENDDCDDFALLDTLAAIEGAIEEKAHNLAVIVNDLNDTSDMIDKEIKRLQLRKKAVEGRVQSIKTYLHTQLELAGIDKIKTHIYSIGLQNNPPSVQIDDPNLIPAQYQIVKFDVDKKAIGEALKNGWNIPGARLTQSRRLSIR